MTFPDAISDDRKRQINALLADIENEAIDKSEWRARKDPLINPHRAGKPDIVVEADCPHCNGAGATGGRRCPTCRGNKRVPDERWGRGEMKASEIRHVQCVVRNVLNYLAVLEDDRGDPILDEQQVHDGQVYEIWREVLAANFGLKKNSLYGKLKGELQAQGLNEYGFVLLLRRLSPAEQRIIESAIDTPDGEHARYLAGKNATTYRAAFRQLVSLMPGVRDEMERKRDFEPTDEDWAFVKKRLREPNKTVART